MKKSFFTVLGAGAIGVGIIGFGSGNAHAAYPDRPVKVIVGFAPGGTNDILARLIANKLEGKLKQPFIVENKAGANSIIAADYSAKAPADGYTLFVASSGAMTINPAVYAKLRYDPLRDFEPVALLGSFPLVVATGANSGISSLDGLKAEAKKSSDNTLAHGVGSSPFQLAAELYANEAEIKFTHVSYKGTGPTITALLGGEIPIAFLDVGALVPQINAGKIKALAVTTAKRSKILPNVPTIAESGLPNYDVPIWTGLVVPKGVPPDVTNALRSALEDILKESDFVDKLALYGMEPGHANASQFAKQIETDTAKWRRVAKAANIKLD